MQPKGSSEAFFVKLLENFTLGCDFSYLIFLWALSLEKMDDQGSFGLLFLTFLKS